MEDLEQLEEQYKKLGDEIECLKKLEGIDWSKMPVDTLVEVRQTPGGDWHHRYFSHAVEDDLFACFDGGKTSATAMTIMPWHEIRLIENNPKPWFGGNCPIPDGVRFRWWTRDTTGVMDSCINTDAEKMCWSWTGEDDDIIAYQILGEA